MNKKVLFAVLLSVAAVFGVSAQKISGDITPLKDQKEVNVVLDFSGTLVNGGSEDKYIADETKGKSESDKAQWLADWNETMRENSYSQLISGLEKWLSDKWFSVGEYKNASYTIIVKVKDITTGTFAGPFSKPSAIKADVSFVKKGDTTPFATVAYKNSKNTFSSVTPVLSARIAMSFVSLGNDLSAAISNALK